jgi:hypothetical protein
VISAQLVVASLLGWLQVAVTLVGAAASMAMPQWLHLYTVPSDRPFSCQHIYAVFTHPLLPPGTAALFIDSVTVMLILAFHWTTRNEPLLANVGVGATSEVTCSDGVEGERVSQWQTTGISLEVRGCLSPAFQSSRFARSRLAG